MREAPSLVSLGVEAVKRALVSGDDHLLLPDIYELPSHLFDLVVSSLPPLALEKLQTQMPFKDWNNYESDHGSMNGRKRGRKGDFNAAWKFLFKLRWPKLAYGIEPVDWRQIYWQTHLQYCLDQAAELAFIPSYSGCLGATEMSDDILKCIGCDSNKNYSINSNLAFHCQEFAHYARCLRLQNVLCVGEICQLLEKSKLQTLALRQIRSKEHVDGLCKLLIQNSRTLKSLEFIHCNLSASFIDKICGSLRVRGMEAHGIEQFSINSSSIEIDPNSLSHALVSFLSSGRSLYKLKLCNNHLDQNFASLLFTTLIDVSSNLSILDLSDNNIAGWLANFDWRSTSRLRLSLGTSKFLKSLHVLNIRGNNLHIGDVESLRHALDHMPNLKVLDISDNHIEDEGMRCLIPYFLETSATCSRLVELKLENCGISCKAVIHLLETLSTLKKPLKSLSLADNDLGSLVGRALGKFLSSSIEVLNIGGIGLGSNGFQELQKEMITKSKLVEIDISKNRGRFETAIFLSKLIPLAPELVAVNATYNLMPVESLVPICTALKVAKGNLERLDLSGNTWELPPTQASMVAEFQSNGKPILILPSPLVPDFTYDDDP